MQYLKTYLNKIIARGNEKLAESISKTAEDIGKSLSAPFRLQVMRSDFCSEMFNQARQDRCLVSYAKPLI